MLKLEELLQNFQTNDNDDSVKLKIFVEVSKERFNNESYVTIGQSGCSAYRTKVYSTHDVGEALSKYLEEDILQSVRMK